MAIQSAGELFGYMAPTAGNTVEVPIVLTDAAGAVVTGVAFDAAGMAVSHRKEGAHSFSAFPTFATENWAECGYGEYVIIIRQSDAAELALMDTEGTLTFYVVATATGGDFAKVKVNTADVERVGATAAALAAYDAATGTDVAAIGAGSGAFEYSVTVQTATGVTFEGIKVALAGPSMEAYVQYTNTSGVAIFHVNAGAWTATAPANGAQAGGHTDFTVSAAGSTVITVVAVSIPAPADPDNWTLYGFHVAADDGDTSLVGSQVSIIKIDGGSVDATANALRSLTKDPATTDVNGLWSFQVAKALDGLTVQVQIVYTTEEELPRTVTEKWAGRLDGTKANGQDQLAWADCNPTKK